MSAAYKQAPCLGGEDSKVQYKLRGCVATLGAQCRKGHEPTTQILLKLRCGQLYSFAKKLCCASSRLAVCTKIGRCCHESSKESDCMRQTCISQTHIQNANPATAGLVA